MGRVLNVLIKLSFYLMIVLIIVAAVVRNPTLSFTNGEKSFAQVDKTALRANVKALTSLHPARNFNRIESLNRAAGHIRQVLQSYGLSVFEQSYVVQGRTYKNILTSIGAKDATERIVVGAHYDVDGDQPGADDNASGVAGLLELARQLKGFKPPPGRRIDFVAYTLEEAPGFGTVNMGSAVHAASLRAENAKVLLMLSLEMIGYYSDAPESQSYPSPAMKALYPTSGNFIAFIGNLQSYGAVRKVKDLFERTSKIPYYSLNAPESFPGVAQSDHASYWKVGYPAVMVTDTAFYRNPNYHRESDKLETLDFDRMADVVSGLYSVLTQY